MAIDFGNDEKKQNYNKAMEVLQKWSGPIYEGAAKRGFGGTSVTKSYDPYKTAVLMRDIPTSGEIMMGGIQGAVSGFMAGGSIAGGMGKDKSIGQAIGAAAGGYLGAASYGTREGGQNTALALNNIAQQAAGWEQQTKQKSAEDAIASMGQRYAVLNNPQTPEEAIKYASEKDALVTHTAQKLYEAGMAPDKAITITESIASIHDPARKDPIGKRANEAMTIYNVSAKTKEDKAELTRTMKQLVMEKRVSQGEMPFDMGTAANVGVKTGAVSPVTMQRPAQQPIVPQQAAAPQQVVQPQQVQAPNNYAAQTNAQGVPAYLAPNIQQPIAPVTGGTITAPPLTYNLPEMPQGASLQETTQPNAYGATSNLPEVNSLSEKIAVYSPELAEKNAVVSTELKSTIAKMRVSGITDPTLDILISNLAKVDTNTDKMLKIIADNKMPDTSAKEVWGSEVYEEGVSSGITGGVGAGVGAAVGAVGFLAGPVVGGITTSAGAGTGTAIGKGFGGIGKGRGFFLEESDKRALGDINSLFSATKTAIAKTADPNSQVTGPEAEEHAILKPKAIKGNVVNTSDILAMKELALTNSLITLSNMAARAVGKEKELILKQQQDLRFEILKKGITMKMEETQKNREKSYGIFWDDGGR